MRDNAETRENKDIDLWVPKKSEKVLVEDWITPTGRVEESCVKITVCKEHCNARCQNREGKKK